MVSKDSAEINKTAIASFVNSVLKSGTNSAKVTWDHEDIIFIRILNKNKNKIVIQAGLNFIKTEGLFLQSGRTAWSMSWEDVIEYH